jgi:hypothetical protein
MASYVLVFDPSGKKNERFSVPAGQVVYLSRAPQVAEGTATVQDLLTLQNYVIPDGVTVCLTTIPPGDVALAFIARSNNSILSVQADVIAPRQGSTPCGS